MLAELCLQPTRRCQIDPRILVLREGSATTILDLLWDKLVVEGTGIATRHDGARSLRNAAVFRRLRVQGVIVLTTERVDWRRFASPRQLLEYLRFVQREDSSGPRETARVHHKAGNAHCRHVLI